MTKDNEDALRCAALLNSRAIMATDQRVIVAGHLRRLVAENEANDALLRQALQVAESQCEYELVAAIRQHLDQKTT